MSRRLRLLVPALLLALVVPLAGCTAWFEPPVAETESTPTNEEVAADLEPFYHQVITWSLCDDGFQCATATAPLDWANPGTDTIELALVRQPATSGDATGSLLVNPGGPGGSGYDFVRDSVDGATTERLQADYDIVGFDPRGVNESTAVACYDDPAELDTYLFGIVDGERGSDDWLAATTAKNAGFSADCLEHTGDLLGFVDTLSAARDLDMLRAALGDEKLNYLGYSYGTLLGATFAELFPNKTGRMVFDGAVDPTVSSFELTLTQAVGFESALRAFLEECPELEGCPFRGTVDESMQMIRGLLDAVDASPLRAPDGRELGASSLFTAIILPLYNAANWPGLASVFASVLAGEAEFAFTVADLYYDRDEDGDYAINSYEAFTAINCLDYATDNNVETMRAEAAQLEAEAPVLGHLMAWGGTSCADWPYPATLQREPIAAAGSSDILVVGTTNDPATPYVWSEALASQLENGHLVTRDGEGHTGYNKENDCVDDTVDGYFLDGTVPASDPLC